MKPILQNDTIQIEITNACGNSCSNCTRFVGMVKAPFFMSFDQFKEAVDSLLEFPNMRGPGPRIGMMGGEPLLHPEFEKFCEYLRSKVKKEFCGLWTCFPAGKEHYREIIVATFGHIFLNDHSRGDIMHKPILVGAEELPIPEWQKWHLIHDCYFQRAWSASINPHGAFFCEIAASMSMLTGWKKSAWTIEPGWWTRTPLHYVEQVKEFCMHCGLAMPIAMRPSTDLIDDISPLWLERLKDHPKVKAGKYQRHNLQLCNDERPLALYKDQNYRQKIAARYGIFTLVNDQSFETPYLSRKWKGTALSCEPALT